MLKRFKCVRVCSDHVLIRVGSSMMINDVFRRDRSHEAYFPYLDVPNFGNELRRKAFVRPAKSLEVLFS